ncbi:MAG: hypothetical protein ACLQK4_05095 [Acidimicrobiales bacterium]
MRAEEPPSGASRTMIAPDTGAVSRSYGPGPETGTSTVLTAEIPAVPAGPNYGVLLPDGTIWYPGSRKRLPAPLILRVVVWSLAFLVLVAGAGDFIIHTHPAWVKPLRRIVPVSSGAPPVTTTHHNGGGTSNTTPKVSISETYPQPPGLPGLTTAYTVTGTSDYVLSVKATGVTWVVAYKLVNGVITGAALFAGDVHAGSTQAISATGPVDLEVAAAGATVTVLSGGKQIGTVATPPSAPWHFRFEPAATKL